ncbi:IMP cyclohydrolase [Candidatus Poribacteria bacterium]|nr:IMP cyclohydrolase [Candidatus Poribacteria bacterium]
MVKIERAIIGVYDKSGVVDFAKELVKYEVEILSTGGTGRTLESADIPVTQVSDYTGFPEMMDGRVKTLHPKIHGGLLAMRDNENHMKEARDNGVKMIDMVVCNLYPFEATVAKPGVTLEEAIENIDIGGPTMIRAAAKNYKDLTVVTDVNQYDDILAEMKTNDGCVSLETRFRMAKAVFELTSHYDTMICEYLKKVGE